MEGEARIARAVKERNMNDTRAFTVEEVAERLKLTPYTVRKFLRLGKLRGTKTSKGKGGDWRISEAAVASYLNNQDHPAALSPGMETAILSEAALRKEWLTPEEDEYWAHL
jgi:excisionase family DNA binding protein